MSCTPSQDSGETESSDPGAELLTFTVITTDPNEVVESTHDRMPVIIPERDHERWLQPGDPARPLISCGHSTLP